MKAKDKTRVTTVTLCKWNK